MNLSFYSRYRPETKALDLKQFHTDATFLGQNIFAPLYRSNVLSVVAKIVGENIPELEAVDLSDNKLRSLEHLDTWAEKAPHVKTLYMVNNNVSIPF